MGSNKMLHAEKSRIRLIVQGHLHAVNHNRSKDVRNNRTRRARARPTTISRVSCFKSSCKCIRDVVRKIFGRGFIKQINNRNESFFNIFVILC